MNRLKEALQLIWDGPCSCSVCRQRLIAAASVSCLAGHVICLSCRRQLPTCLICKKQFSNETHAAFKRVLELLPKYCRHEGCSAMPEDNPRLVDHELWCGNRASQCRLCNWSGHAKDLYSHCLKQHIVIHKSQKPLDMVLNLTQDQSSLCLMNTQDQIFWVTCGFDRATEIISIQVLWEPNGAVTRNLFEANVNFDFGSSRTSMSKPIVHHPTIDVAQRNLFKIHKSSLKCFNAGDTIRFGLVIVKT